MEYKKNKKTALKCYLYSCFGLFGINYFYVGKIKEGIAKFLVSLCFIFYFIFGSDDKLIVFYIFLAYWLIFALAEFADIMAEKGICLKCSHCKSTNIITQQVATGSTTKSKTKHYVKYHSLLYMLTIGWIFIILSLFFDAIMAFMTFGFSLFFKKKKNVGVSKGKEKTKMKMQTVCTCQHCGNAWSL